MAWAWSTRMLLVLLACQQTCSAAQSGYITDKNMGIFSYSFPVEKTHLYRLHLRFVCGTSKVAVHGFVGVYPFSYKPPDTSRQRPHYTAPPGARPMNCQTINLLDNNTTVELQWIRSEAGFWRVKASISRQGLHLLKCGSGWQHVLPSTLCAQHGDQQQQQLPSDGVWNVITTTSNPASRPYVERLAFLLLEHHMYIRKLGVNGTILRGNAAETQQLLQLDSIKEAVYNQNLVLWPWDHEHSAGTAPHYWQQPKNQLTLLGAYGRHLRLSFFDLDEYLVIPAGGSILTAQCGGQPLLQPDFDSWDFKRYQAKTCKGSGADVECWQSGTPLPRSNAVQYWQELCPMGNGKPLFVADMVETMSVHKTHKAADAGALGAGSVPRGCAFLLHFFTLMSSRREEVVNRVLSKPPTTWSLDEHGRGVIRVADGVKLYGSDAECQEYWALTFGPQAGKGKRQLQPQQALL